MNETPSQQSVVVTDVRMPFWSMVVFMVKWAIAAIPAMIILVLVVVASMAIVSGLVASIGRTARDRGTKVTALAQTPQRSSTTTASVALTPDQQAYVDKMLV